MSLYNDARTANPPSDDFNGNDNSLPPIAARGRTVVGQPISVSTEPPFMFAPYPTSEEPAEASQTMIWTALSAINDSLGVSINAENPYTTADAPAMTTSRMASTWTITTSAPVIGSMLQPPWLATTPTSTTTDTGSSIPNTSAVSTEPPTTFTMLSPTTLSPLTNNTNESLPTNGTSPPLPKSAHRTAIAGPVVGALSAFLLILALFLCYRRRVLCFRRKPIAYDSPYGSWSETRGVISEKSTVVSMNGIEPFPPLDLGEPGPAVTADDLEHLPSNVHTLSEVVAARTVTPPAAAAAHRSQMHNKRATATRHKHTRTISDTTVCSSALSDPFRTPSIRDDQTPNISQVTFSPNLSTDTRDVSEPVQPHHSEVDKSSIQSHFLTAAPPRSKSPTQPCPLIPSQVLLSSNQSNKDQLNRPRRPIVRRASSLSSTSMRSHHASEKFVNAETLYIGKARHMNLHSLRRHSLTPRIVNIMTNRNCSTVLEPPSPDGNEEGIHCKTTTQPPNRAMSSGRARSVSPVRSVRLSGASTSLYSGSPAKLGKYFDIHSHSHSQDFNCSHTRSEKSGLGGGEGGKRNGASRAYNQIVADINR